MHDTLVTQLWMAGVMLIMTAYGIIAVVGLAKRRKRQ